MGNQWKSRLFEGNYLWCFFLPAMFDCTAKLHHQIVHSICGFSKTHFPGEVEDGSPHDFSPHKCIPSSQNRAPYFNHVIHSFTASSLYMKVTIFGHPPWDSHRMNPCLLFQCLLHEPSPRFFHFGLRFASEKIGVVSKYSRVWILD